MNLKTYTLAYKRKREGRTNYRKRLKLLSSYKPRLVVRRALKNMTVQIVEYNPTGDKVLLSASSKQLQKKYGWNKSRGNKAAAYLTGFLLGKEAKYKGFTSLVLDIGSYPNIKGSRVYAALKGVVDNSINVPHSKDILPSDSLIVGSCRDEFENTKKRILGNKNGKKQKD